LFVCSRIFLFFSRWIKAPIVTQTADGWTEYRVDGLLHRIGGPARVLFSASSPENKQPPAVLRAEYYFAGHLHRVGGPAVINYENGTFSYYRHGKLHRKDGPAVRRETAPSVYTLEYWLDGVAYTADEFEDYVEQDRKFEKISIARTAEEEKNQTKFWKC
jgi:hypothetical protein